MGAGATKTHQAFTISPAHAPDAATPTASGAPAASAVADDFSVDEAVIDPAEVKAVVVGDGTPTGPAAVQPGPIDHADWDLALTPLPAGLTPGDGVGIAVAVGGADLVDGAATLIAYRHPDGHSVHEVLTCTLTPDAEAKLLDAVASPDAPMIPVQVDTVLSGRIPLDEQHELHEQLARVAKSINHHLADGTPIPAHTHDRLAQATATLDELAAQADPGSTEATMLAHYQAAATACAERCADGYDTAYSAGGKIPMVDPYVHSGPATITQLVPDPTWDGGDGLVAATRPASRIAAHLANGDATWDGASRVKGKGSELVVDLGDGFAAVYRPATMNAAGTSDLSLRGTLEITAPAGPGHHHELVDRLGRLNIVNRPMNPTEAEWAYLQRNIYAHQLEAHPAITAALTDGHGLEDAHEQTLFAARAYHAVGLDDAGLRSFARQLRLDAEADALGDKVHFLRNGMAAALGVNGGGAALATAPGYQPTPRRVGGWLTWDRIGHDPNSLQAAFAGKSLVHHVTGHNLAALMSSGVFVSTERRRMMGITNTLGMSESSDQVSGGARSVFVRLRNTNAVHTGTAQLVWDDPGRLLARTDWYGYNGDHFGAVEAGTGHSVKGQTRNPAVAATFSASNNEIMIAHGLDLLGAHAPTRVICSSAKERKSIVAQLTAAGITHLGGRPLTKVIT